MTEIASPSTESASISMTSIISEFFILSVIYSEKSFLSTASAEPAGTLVASAALIIKEP